jgi:hypothetical protein
MGTNDARSCRWLSFLERNGYRFVPVESEDPDEVVASQIEALAAGSLDEGDFGRWLVDWVRRDPP